MKFKAHVLGYVIVNRYTVT